MRILAALAAVAVLTVGCASGEEAIDQIRDGGGEAIQQIREGIEQNASCAELFELRDQLAPGSPERGVADRLLGTVGCDRPGSTRSGG